MLAIRLKRIGKKHQASYRMVVGERRSKLKGDSTEDIGWFNPIIDKGEFKAERVKYWLSVGAKPSPTVHNLLVRFKVIDGKKIPNHKQAEKNDREAAAAPVAAAAAAPAATEAPAEPTASA